MRWCAKCHGLSSAAAPPNSTTFELTYNSPDTVARTGDDIFLGCTFEAATLPKYQWRYRGLNDANATRLPEKTSGLLELRAVKLENAGVYECEAYIKDGERTLSQSAPIVLTVKGELISRQVCMCSSPHTVRQTPLLPELCVSTTSLCILVLSSPLSVAQLRMCIQRPHTVRV